MQRLLAVPRRLRRALQRRGLVAVTRGGIDYLRRTPARRRVARIEADFDRRYGVQTAGIVRLDELDIDSENKDMGVRYEGTMPELFEALMDGVPVGPGVTFIDVGCGKGRVLLLAALHPFKRVVGVEFSPELSAIARENARRFDAPGRQCDDIEVVCIDATAYEFPHEPLVVYIYNAFEPPVMARVLARLDESLTAHPRPFTLLLANRTVTLETLAGCGFEPLDPGYTRFSHSPR
jgi:SAM-dependent methyltransferase